MILQNWPCEGPIILKTGTTHAHVNAYHDEASLERSRSLATRCEEAGLEYELTAARILEGTSLRWLSRFEEALQKLRAVRVELIQHPESIHHSTCARMIAVVLMDSGRWEEACAFSHEAIVSASRLENRYLESLAWLNLSYGLRGLARWGEAERAAEKAVSGLEALGHSHFLTQAHQIAAIVQWKRGRLNRAEERARLSHANATRLGNSMYSFSRLLLACIHTHRGQFAQALDAVAIGEKDPLSRPSLLAIEYLGDIHLEQGQAKEALAHYDDVWPKAMALVARGDIVAELRRRRAECHLLLGDAAAAIEACRESLEHCREIGDRYEEAATYRVFGLAAAALGRYDEAKKHFDQGFAMYDDIETPFEWGKLWLAYGDWLCGPHAGHYEHLGNAREAYVAAVDHFEHMGAEFRLGEARQRLAALEERIRLEGAPALPANGKAKPLRRPRVSAELQRRCQWALDTFGMVTRSRPVLEMLEELSAVAKSDMPVLILGESGTGKELVSRGVHGLSGRIGQFVAVNCSAIPSTMLEDEFFGHLRGAFTNATMDKPGLFEVADCGTIFLDEIGEMPVDLQSKMLRFLETNEVRRVGDTTDRRVNTRVVAATNRSRERMQDGQGFRSDLYYRLAHAVYTLPPLRQREDDVELLVEHFLAEFNTEYGKQVVLSGAARERLLLNSWPGNVRQLRAVMEKMVVSAPVNGVLTPRDVPAFEVTGAPRTFFDERDAHEKRRIVEALEQSGFVKADAARILRMSRTGLLSKMKRFGIEA